MPRYDVACQACGDKQEVQISYAEYDVYKDGFFASIEPCSRNGGDPCIWRFALNRSAVPPIHYKGYGFYRTDNASLEEKYARDHFDGSGTNAEIKAMERRIKDPQSTVPGAQVVN